ncbi:protein UXT [Vespula squamosa]|uniref:Protein UXT n=1 Tax=Vespula squamosa TaxID=30214 RepID=A0ABD2BRN2_VESSQ
MHIAEITWLSRLQDGIVVNHTFMRHPMVNRKNRTALRKIIMNPDIQKKILQFEAFINGVLRVDLAKLEEKLDSKNTDIAEFLQLKNIITTFQSSDFNKKDFKTQVDIGNNFYVEAHVQDVSNILLDVGLGHYVEFSLEEALVIINVRIKLFEKQIAHIRKQIARTNAHIKLILIGIRDLQGLQ